MSKPFNEQAAFLIEDALDLIKQVLVKHPAAVLEEMRDQITTRNDEIKQLTIALKIKTEEHNCCADDLALVRGERDAFADLNHTQFLELEYLRPIVQSAENLLFESEEYDFDDGLGKGAQQTHWDDLASTLEPKTEAIEEMLNASPVWAIRRNGGDSSSDAKPPAYRFLNVTCSQCGGEFGPADHEFSHCENHKHLPRLA